MKSFKNSIIVSMKLICSQKLRAINKLLQSKKEATQRIARLSTMKTHLRIFSHLHLELYFSIKFPAIL